MTAADDDLVDLMLDGPWQPDAMQLRIARARGRLLVPDDVAGLVAAVCGRFAQPPARDVLARFLAEPPGLLDPRTEVGALCQILATDVGELMWFADVQSRERRAAPRLQHYRWRALPKRGGVRLVAAPKPRLKEIQRRVLRRLDAEIPLHESAHGGVRSRSVASALAPHAGARVLVHLDLESFFPTVTAGRVRGLLRRFGVAPAVGDAIAGLCTTAMPARVWREVPRAHDMIAVEAQRRLRERLVVPHLPQGAPTSPLLANAIAFGLDRRLAALAGGFDASYTRYVDDLVFSGGRSLHRGRAGFIAAAESIVRDEGFGLAAHKTSVRTSAGRMAALGAVVNDHPALPREERDRLRAIVHNCRVHGVAGQSVARSRLLGRIAAAGALDARFAARLRADFDRIDWPDEDET
jgi:RNA-directed DNA polymerase